MNYLFYYYHLMHFYIFILGSYFFSRSVQKLLRNRILLIQKFKTVHCLQKFFVLMSFELERNISRVYIRLNYPNIFICKWDMVEYL
jgi:hypothetical protein